MDLSSQRQYIQRAETAQSHTSQPQMYNFYTSPSGGDFDFSISSSLS